MHARMRNSPCCPPPRVSSSLRLLLHHFVSILHCLRPCSSFALHCPSSSPTMHSPRFDYHFLYNCQDFVVLAVVITVSRSHSTRILEQLLVFSNDWPPHFCPSILKEEDTGIKRGYPMAFHTIFIVECSMTSVMRLPTMLCPLCIVVNILFLTQPNVICKKREG